MSARGCDGFELAVRTYDDPDVTRLVAEVQQEYVRRYGGPDDTPVQPAQFAAPGGHFVVGLLDGQAVAMGGWRAAGEHTVEIKRMYVSPRAQRRGLARRVLAALEDAARRAGNRRIILETGSAQPEAVALYRTSGYEPVAAFGHYADAEESIHLGKNLDVTG